MPPTRAYFAVNVHPRCACGETRRSEFRDSDRRHCRACIRLLAKRVPDDVPDVEAFADAHADLHRVSRNEPAR